MSIERAFCQNKEHLPAFRAYGLPEKALAKGSPISAVSIASDSAPILNFTSPEGHELGKKLAAWCDDAEPGARLVEPSIPPRCASCAFRAGIHLANGSPATQMDALKSVIEQTPFECHDVHRTGDLCSGWLMMTLAHGNSEPGKAPWDFIGGVEP